MNNTHFAPLLRESALLRERALKEANVRRKVYYLAGLGSETDLQLCPLRFTVVLPNNTLLQDGLGIKIFSSAGHGAAEDIDHARHGGWQLKCDLTAVIGRREFRGNKIRPCLRIGPVPLGRIRHSLEKEYS